jgi:hypothetical protein
MTRIEFEQLNKQEQIRVISKYGVFLADKIDSGNRLYLYVVNTFYVELLHELSNINSKGLVITRVFDDAGIFNDYQDKADANRLYA